MPITYMRHGMHCTTAMQRACSVEALSLSTSVCIACTVTPLSLAPSDVAPLSISALALATSRCLPHLGRSWQVEACETIHWLFSIHIAEDWITTTDTTRRRLHYTLHFTTEFIRQFLVGRLNRCQGSYFSYFSYGELFSFVRTCCSWGSDDVLAIVKLIFLDLRGLLVASGIQPHPGPTRFTASEPCVLNVLNGGSLITHFEAFIQRPAHILAISEHSVPPDERLITYERLKAANISGVLSHLDPELKHHTGGVTTLTRQPAKVDILSPRSDSMAALLASGRVQMTALDIGYSSPLLNFTIYGWTGGRQSPKAAERTDDIFRIIALELSLRPDGPVAIMGDVNADLFLLPPCISSSCAIA